jgi:hypothetical protein
MTMRRGLMMHLQLCITFAYEPRDNRSAMLDGSEEP